ncbi:MAG: hypothetical protein J0H63_04075, partial [Rhizobiales bacterium]|nr:hypothetical protein [Hyphomicrobiales bacterium]
MALHFDGATTALPGTDILAPATDSRAIDHAGEITLSLYDSLEACAVAWRTFEEVADHTVFQTFGWLSTWMRTVGGRTRARPAIVIGQAPNGAVLFLMPFAVERHAMVSRLTWLGSDLSDYNAPLLAPGFAAAMCARRFAALWRRIRGS